MSGVSTTFAYAIDDRWQPGIGDPTFMGWLTVVAYWIAGVLCWRAGWNSEAKPSAYGTCSRSRIFWSFFGLFLVLLGINKQLDLQTWFTLFVKRLALEQGWYEHRRLVQTAFILIIAAAGAGLLFGLAWLARGSPRYTKFALMGGFFLGVFVLIRASSFHHVDQMLGIRFAGLQLNWILELSGIACVALAAAMPPRPRGDRI